MEKCIYRFESPPLIKSHIIPECLGSKHVFPDSVCDECNSIISREIEAEACDILSFFRMILQLKTKGKYATAQAEINVFGEKFKIPIRKGFKPKSKYIRPIIIKKGSYRDFYILANSQEKLKKQMKELTKSGIKFEEKKITPIDPKLTFEFKFNEVNSVNFLRLATKIGFERFCEYRPQQAFSDEFNPIRKYILEGKQGLSKNAFLIFEERLIKTNLYLPFPYHGIFLFGFNKIIGSIVIIFGLFYYFVLLNSNAYLLKDWYDFIYIDPIAKKTRFPILSSPPSLLDLMRKIKKSLRDKNSHLKAIDYARKKFNQFLKETKMLEEDGGSRASRSVNDC